MNKMLEKTVKTTCSSECFPGLNWWATACVGVFLGTLLSEAICMRWELRAIELSSSDARPVTKNGYERVSNQEEPIGNAMNGVEMTKV